MVAPMKILPTPLDGPAFVELDQLSDDRGWFARAFCREEFEMAGLEPAIAQSNFASTRSAGTLRGFHYQEPPWAEAKLVWCIRGQILDAVVDVRPDSPSYLQHFTRTIGETGDAAGRVAIYVPPGFAHGYLTLTPDVEVLYQVSAPYAPDAERGLRHDDPVLGVSWPIPVTTVSEKDRSWPLLPPAAAPVPPAVR
jgi:dTDP-4-dehydrorhamnose 3,5-epimerase